MVRLRPPVGQLKPELWLPVVAFEVVARAVPRLPEVICGRTEVVVGLIVEATSVQQI